MTVAVDLPTLGLISEENVVQVFFFRSTRLKNDIRPLIWMKR